MDTMKFLLALAAVLLASFVYLIVTFPCAADWEHVAANWEPYKLTDSQKQWFSKLKPRTGAIPCCSVADGVPADDWERRYDDTTQVSMHYWVNVNGKWLQVPDEAVIKDAGNPVGVPVVWFYHDSSGIRCFVPGLEN